jgi:putative membrane protein
MEQFLAQSLHTTKGRTGVMIYVSFAEHYAEVIADEGIYRKVPQTTWNEVVDALTANLGRGARVEGFVTAIETCGKILAEHFPPGGIDLDELPNHLIVLDGRWSA